MNDLDIAVESEDSIARWLADVEPAEFSGALDRVSRLRPDMLAALRTRWAHIRSHTKEPAVRDALRAHGFRLLEQHHFGAVRWCVVGG